MGIKKSNYFKKVIFVFALLLIVLGIFRLNVREFFLLKQDAENSLPQKNDKFAFLNMEHIGILFENPKLNSAIFILPDTDYKYNTENILLGYKKRQNFTLNYSPVPDTVYIAKEDTSCVYEETCGENLEKILNLAQKYNMLPKVYDLTDFIKQENVLRR